MLKLALRHELPFVPFRRRGCEEFPVLHCAVVFLVIALITAFPGFGGIAAGAAKLLLSALMITAGVAFLPSLVRKR